MSATGRSGLRTASTAGYLAAVNTGVATRAGSGAARPQEARIGAELKAAQERGEQATRERGGANIANGVRASDTLPTQPEARDADIGKTTLDEHYGNNQIRTHGGNVRSSDISSSTLDVLGIPSPKEGVRSSDTFVAVRQPVQRDVRSADIAPTNGARASGTVATAAQERGELATQARHPSSVRASDTAPTTLHALGIPSQRARKSINVRSTGIGARFPQRHAVASWKHVGNGSMLATAHQARMKRMRR